MALNDNIHSFIALTHVVVAGVELCDVDMTGAGGDGCDPIIAIRQCPPGEDPGDYVARRVVALAHAALVRLLARAKHTIAAHHLKHRERGRVIFRHRERVRVITREERKCGCAYCYTQSFSFESNPFIPKHRA